MTAGLLLQLASAINATLHKPNAQEVDEEEKGLLLQFSLWSKPHNPSLKAALELSHLLILRFL